VGELIDLAAEREKRRGEKVKISATVGGVTVTVTSGAATSETLLCSPGEAVTETPYDREDDGS
jgi:hypothetical protein